MNTNYLKHASIIHRNFGALDFGLILLKKKNLGKVRYTELGL